MHTTQTPTRWISRLSFGCLLLVSVLMAGCAASRNYPGPVHGLTFNGTVQSVDLLNKHLTLTPLKPSPPMVFTWEKTTKFYKNGVSIRPEFVELGKSIRIHYHESSGKLVAHHVYLQVPYAPPH